jgi:uncharacterized protein (DUF1501 family)
MSNLNIVTRRAFLSHSAKLGLGVALSTLVDIPFVMKRALAEGSIGLNGKKLLFIWLRGANDALNSVVPVLDSAYTPSRPTLALPTDSSQLYGTANRAAYDATLFNGSMARTPSDPTYSYGFATALGNGFAALHPSLKFLAPVYNVGELALVHRVGYPKQSRSHFDSQNYWENGNPNNNLSQDGIFYRTMVESGLANTQALTGVSIQSSLPLILRGSAAAMTNLSDPERYALLGIPNDTNGLAKASAYLTNAVPLPFAPKKNRELLSLQYANLAQTLAVFDKIDFDEGHNTYQDDLKTDGDTDWVPINQNGTSIGDPTRGYFLFPTDDANNKNGGWRRPDRSITAGKYVVDPSHKSFFKNLKAAALVLNQTDAIICGTQLDGFDTHKAQGTLNGAHPILQRAIGWSIYALRKFFKLYGKGGPYALPGAKASWDDVVVVTLSEFGRTTIENSDLGTDHAEAGVMFVAGGAVKGYGKGNAYGVFNCSTSGEPLLWTPGNGGSMFGVSGRYLQRNTDYRSVLGEIIRKHLGATQSQLDRIIAGYANSNEKLLLGGASGVDGTQIRGEVGIL